MEKQVFVVGCNGKMGRIVCNLIDATNDLYMSGGYDKNYRPGEMGLSGIVQHDKVDLCDCRFKMPEVIIDFSKPEATMEVLPQAVAHHIPMVIATTGFTPEQEARIKEAATVIPIFKSSNMALSTKRFIKVVKCAASIFTEPYEILIHEIHHSRKADAPSGTAKMLFDAVNEARGNTLTYRFDSNAKKDDNEVWVSAGRVGNFRGQHIVTIAGANDYVQLLHSIDNRAVFAEGALDAARYIMEQTEPRIYTMDDLFNE